MTHVQAVRMPSLRHFNVKVYEKIVFMLMEAKDRIDQARARYLAVIDQLMQSKERRAKLVAVLGEWDGLRTAWEERVKPAADVVRQELQRRMAESQEEVQEVGRDVAQAFFDIPKMTDELVRQAAEFEQKVNDLLGGFEVSAALPLIVEVAPGLAKQAPRRWTPDDLQFVEKFRRMVSSGRRAQTNVEKFFSAVEGPHKPWSAKLMDQLRKFYDELERGGARQTIDELNEIEMMVREALSADMDLDQPLSQESKDILQAYMDRAEQLEEIGERATQLVAEIQREEVPAGRWPELQELEELEKTIPPQIEEARGRRERGEISPEVFREIEDKFKTDLAEARRKVEEIRSR